MTRDEILAKVRALAEDWRRWAQAAHDAGRLAEMESGCAFHRGAEQAYLSSARSLDAILAAAEPVSPAPVGARETTTLAQRAFAWVREHDPWTGLTADDRECHCLFCKGEFEHAPNCLWVLAAAAPSEADPGRSGPKVSPHVIADAALAKRFAPSQQERAVEHPDVDAPRSASQDAAPVAQSKSEYKRRVAQGDPNVQPPDDLVSLRLKLDAATTTVARLGAENAALRTMTLELRGALDLCATDDKGWPHTEVADAYEASRRLVPDAAETPAPEPTTDTCRNCGHSLATHSQNDIRACLRAVFRQHEMQLAELQIAVRGDRKRMERELRAQSAPVVAPESSTRLRLLEALRRDFRRLLEAAPTAPTFVVPRGKLALLLEPVVAAPAPTPEPPREWRCFHCDEVFTTDGSARDHFGATQGSTPGCLIDRVALEEGGKPERGRGLLMALRKAEDEIAQLRLDNEELENDSRLWHGAEADRKRRIGDREWWQELDHREGEKLVLEQKLAEAVAAPAETPTWQPIETHPHNKIVLVYYVNELGNGRTMRAQFYDVGTLEMGDEEDFALVREDGKNVESGWFEESEAYEYLQALDGEPTHWMPLPSPPSGAPTP